MLVCYWRLCFQPEASDKVARRRKSGVAADRPESSRVSVCRVDRAFFFTFKDEEKGIFLSFRMGNVRLRRL